MGKLLVGLGVWFLSDALYSLALYLGKPGYHGATQNWLQDHSVRVVRGCAAVAIIVIGAMVD